MRPLALLPAASLVFLWTLALWLWPHLPEQIPLHFDGAGAPDRFGARTPWNWFLLPGIATALVGLFAFALPPWIASLARNNSAYLSVPRKEDFARLTPDARVRAVSSVGVMLQVIAAELALLFSVMLYGTERVANGVWPGLPTAMVFGAFGLLLSTTLVWLPLFLKAVERELAQAEG
jgi:uncharacterized membrane protein